MLTDKTNKQAQPKGTELKLVNILKAVDDVLPDTGTIYFQGANRTKPQFKAMTQAVLDPYQKTRQAHADVQRFSTERRDGEKAAKQYVLDVQVAVATAFGATSAQYGKFGFSTRKQRATLTPEQKLARAQKARATRAARHPFGLKPKKGTGQPKPAATPVPTTPTPAPTAPATGNGTPATK